MKKNVAGQKIGVQMVSATDGSAFTDAVTVYVTGDAGTQAAGSVGSGACTHEGNGYHTYAPAQAETDYDLIAFTFIGTGAVPATVQVFTVPTKEDIADTVLQRDSSNWEASAGKKSLGAAVMQSVHHIEDDGAGHLIVYRSDGTTEHYRRDITTNAALVPIEDLGGAA